MSDNLPPHELLASDEYWGDIIELPEVPIRDSFLDELNRQHIFAQFGAAAVQKLYRSAQRDSQIINRVKPGDVLPIVERGEGLVRVVEDLRRFPLSDTTLANWWLKKLKQDTPEHFDDIARKMLSDHLYSGENASMSLVDNDGIPNLRIWRVVHYLTGSKSGSQLEGITSPSLFRPAHQIGFNSVLPPLTVGETYRRNKAGTLISKVISAELLIAGGTKQKVPKKSLFYVEPRFAYEM